MITAVHLDQHARSGHPLATDPVLGWTAPARTAQTSVQQDAPKGGPADVDAFPLAQQFAQMGMVDSLVSSTGQMHHIGITASGVALTGLRPRWPCARAAAPSSR